MKGQGLPRLNQISHAQFMGLPMPKLLSPQVWRLRAYRNERTLGAAKPLWFMKRELNLGKGVVQRII